MRAGDVAGRHCDRDLGWYVGDRREVGDLAQHPAGYHAGAARRVGADQHAIERVARAHGPHELEDHARIPRATDLERALGLGHETLDFFLRHRDRPPGGVTHDCAFWAGVNSPIVGCECESIRPGIAVIPSASMTTSAARPIPEPTSRISPSSI